MSWPMATFPISLSFEGKLMAPAPWTSFADRLALGSSLKDGSATFDPTLVLFALVFVESRFDFEGDKAIAPTLKGSSDDISVIPPLSPAAPVNDAKGSTVEKKAEFNSKGSGLEELSSVDFPWLPVSTFASASENSCFTLFLLSLFERSLPESLFSAVDLEATSSRFFDVLFRVDVLSEPVLSLLDFLDSLLNANVFRSLFDTYDSLLGVFD
mmetsp:Transcript_17823/g.26373  ORF Transcript_17823/g.26373 Transcript_17823/m.26373 type:complete len:212 (-) Transcript_17823:1880-2515(-)